MRMRSEGVKNALQIGRLKVRPYLPVAAPLSIVIEITVAMAASPPDIFKVPVAVPATSKVVLVA